MNNNFVNERNAVICQGYINFQGNCHDVSTTKVVDVYHELEEYGIVVDIYDPWADAEEVKHEYYVDILSNLDRDKKYDAIVVAVSHQEFLTMDLAA